MSKRLVGINRLIISALAIAAIGTTCFFIWQENFSGEAKTIKQVRRSLYDPGSATFENVRFNRKTGAGCGLVNAKNKYGGYVGFTRFIVFAAGEVTIEPTDASGTPKEQLAALEKKIEFIKLLQAKCTKDITR